MKYEVRSFWGKCPKDNIEKFVPVFYQPTYNLEVGNCLEKYFPECKCGIDCPTFNEAPQHLPPNN